ncbi:MAG: low molecular weight protein arginine phosphatase, partial [Pseudomonadota bacterium]
DWVDWADRIYVMEEIHRVAIADRFPQATRKTQLLDPSGDIPDPIGKSAATYAACLNTIRTHLSRLLH